MRRPVRRSIFRAGLGLVAATVLAAGSGAAVPALAADGDPLPVRITGENHVDLSLQGDNGDPAEPQITLRLAAPGSDEPGDDGEVPVAHQGRYRITIDAGGLAGVAQAKLPCTTSGATATCEGDRIHAGEKADVLGGIRLDIPAGGSPRRFGEITVTGEGEGVAFAPLHIQVVVSDSRIVSHELPAPGVGVGGTWGAPLGLRNAGRAPADGVVLRFRGTRGLNFPDSYGNCVYRHTTDGPLKDQGTDAICAVSGVYEAGAAYEVTEPLKVKTAAFALNDLFTYSFAPADAGQAKALPKTGGYTPGTGAPLTLRKLAGTPSGVYSSKGTAWLPQDNSYDILITGDSARGAVGDKVTVNVGFRNLGPAWVRGLEPPDDDPMLVYVALPPGTTATKIPEDCWAGRLDDGSDGYGCWAHTPVLEDANLTFPFELRIDKVVENAKGRIRMQPFDYPSEPDQDNNSAWIVLNAADDDGSTQGTTGGPSADPSPSAPGGPSADPSPGASGGDTSGSTGATGGDGPASSGGTSGGGLASTGAGGAVLLGGGALLALGLGAVLVVVVRRRSA
ncbi:hypothetical protein JK361_12265 [Streptomyces sp. 5-8]|uniref:Gram-positive cocci surface proteins LPxTG domain-containing protein n=1 Tax=Streptomyces musisoli TaxID=2802280 RepID=A0ABS1NZF1_9ACTN|nr:hypothetical protein [Streptomyces musisoli]MBL1105354.1 hypothetical protein [Streptomyces musisoli]